ncbi:Lipase-like protein [Hapsidospora chrysogenum ATCC 11550]|uniref:Lipase-like protein n=1 Tax=Hapsidospora chrysogenum (strain ATCC 11550 / CBS 779.69 / DSM 880 / IAM 14645 / JCM 23072 / IMI 49137) TaxID=857340 RepID=A0A086T478_HAPC1|nr:Lipase-like protein [Hapsidospora chrysogenum ATCC 11550]
MRCLVFFITTALLLSTSEARPRSSPSAVRIQAADRSEYLDGTVLDVTSTAGDGDGDVVQAAPRPRLPGRPHRRPTGFVAFGDSYSAGIGTGVNGTEEPCRRGLHAHPMLINEDLARQGPSTSTSFQFLSCTGARIQDLLLHREPSQIGEFNTTHTADFALLSIGGNDLGFFDIMNSCIFRFYSFYSGTCEEALHRAEVQLAGPDFENYLRLAIMEILDRVHWEKRPWFTITVTGYARFFNAETEECDNCSFGVWWRGPQLKRELRSKMNEMVLAVNDKIRRSVNAVNRAFVMPRVLFVDYDSAFEGHRFCEPNVTEPDYTRNETWFFLVGGSDNAYDTTTEAQRFTEGDLLPLSSPLINPNVCMDAAAQSGDWGQLSLCMMATAAERDPTLRLSTGEPVAEGTSMWYVPTYYGQTFHPVG